MQFYRLLHLLLLTAIACDPDTEKPIEEDGAEEEDRVDEPTDPFGDATGSDTTDGETDTDDSSDAPETDTGDIDGGDATGDETDTGEVSDESGGTDASDAEDSSDEPDGDIGGLDGGGSSPDGGGGSEDTTGGAEGITGDGVFDVDQMFVLFNGAYRDGLSTTATFTNEEGETDVADNYFRFTWIDSTDYAGDPDEYICNLTYKTAGAATADFTEFGMPDSAYMQFLMDLPSSTPDTSGDCEAAAMTLGIDDMTAFVETTPWGFGYGPMTDAFESEITLAIDDYATLGDRPGATYLRWQNAEGDAVNSWGYFQVIPFLDDESSALDLDLSLGEDTEFAGGVRDRTEPTDGYFFQSTVYLLTFTP